MESEFHIERYSNGAGIISSFRKIDVNAGDLENGQGRCAVEEGEMTITGEQVKEARKLLKWSLLDLGYRARVSDSTIATFETARRPIRAENVQAIQRALEAAGIEFDDKGHGVRMREANSFRSSCRRPSPS